MLGFGMGGVVLGGWGVGPAGGPCWRVAVQNFFSCFSLFDLVLYFLGHHLQMYGVPKCTSFTCLFNALRLLHAFPHLGQCFVISGLDGFDREASFSPELLGPTTPISSSEAVAGSACGEGGLVA